MKYLKLFEGFGKGLEEMNVEELVKYGYKRGWFNHGTCHINFDDSVDVNGNVYMSDNYLEYIPINFDTVTGDFNIRFNKLTSLKGCPREVGRNFNCNNNETLKTLDNLPIRVGGIINFENCGLISTKGLNNVVCDEFELSKNNISDLTGCPKHTNRLILSDNNITSLQGVSLTTSILSVANNPLQSFKGSKIVIEDRNGYSNKIILDNVKLKNTIDLPSSMDYISLVESEFPMVLRRALMVNIKLNKIIELQDYYNIWKSDDSINVPRFDMLIKEIGKDCQCGGTEIIECEECGGDDDECPECNGSGETTCPDSGTYYDEEDYG